jgi:hypothetical protein
MRQKKGDYFCHFSSLGTDRESILELARSRRMRKRRRKYEEE